MLSPSNQVITLKNKEYLKIHDKVQKIDHISNGKKGSKLLFEVSKVANNH